jgi:uncharacterized LabA/DUF88 family protein
LPEERLKIAVFVDFDNIEIGVKNTLNRNFDISAVLEAIKERGEIVTKIAYGDWKRAGDYGRKMGQHAIQMVQRNLTPGGDKNGADINLALDALEMAFTLSHINAFVIVGGDSDFMTLVEKLKQYDKKVIVVGGRGFTSTILQKNCHEFIAYENLIRPSSPGRRQTGGRSRSTATGDTPIKQAIPLVRRSLKVLSDREVSPQLGLLKSTLLQLDSTFSERDYGATTFRDFIEKLARTGAVTLKQVDRSLLVELAEGDDGSPEEEIGAGGNGEGPTRAEAEPGDNSAGNVEEGLAVIRSVFDKAETPLKWPMYVRGIKQYIKSIEPDFDERAYGFTGLLDALRQSQKAGVFRLERNRQGVLRVYPGEAIIPSAAVATSESTSESISESMAASASEVTAPVTEPVGESDEEKKTTKKTSTKKATKKTSKKTTKKATKKKVTKKTTKKTTTKKTTKTASETMEPEATDLTEPTESTESESVTTDGEA